MAYITVAWNNISPGSQPNYIVIWSESYANKNSILTKLRKWSIQRIVRGGTLLPSSRGTRTWRQRYGEAENYGGLALRRVLGHGIPKSTSVAFYPLCPTFQDPCILCTNSIYYHMRSAVNPQEKFHYYSCIWTNHVNNPIDSSRTVKFYITKSQSRSIDRKQQSPCSTLGMKSPVYMRTLNTVKSWR